MTIRQKVEPERPIMDERRSWHLDKSVPIAIIFSFMFQTFIAVWWASAITKDVDTVKKTQDEMKLAMLTTQGNRYTSVDANKDLGYVADRHNMLERRVNANEDRLRAIESKSK